MRASRDPSKRVILVTGTDTGVGKTLITALLVLRLRRTGIRALAMKPICSGGDQDVRILRGIIDGELRMDEINPFYFREAIAPLVAQQRCRRVVRRDQVLERIRALQARCECLVVEGAGGLRSPLGADLDSARLAVDLGCPVVVVARNQLGVINHALLATDALQGIGCKRIMLVLTGARKRDISSHTNARVLRELRPGLRLVEVPYLGDGLRSARAVKEICKKNEKTLARLVAFASFCAAVNRKGKERGKKIG